MTDRRLEQSEAIGNTKTVHQANPAPKGHTMTIENGISLFLIIFIFAITPGPGVFALLGRSLASGARSCLSLALGMAVSDVIYLVLACFGLAVIAEQWSGLFTVIRLGGAAYLLYLGYQMWQAPHPQSAESRLASSTGFSTGLLQGFLISASNPKVILFYIAFLPTIMDLTTMTGPDIVLASGITLVALMAGLMLIAVGGSTARSLFSSKRGVRRLNRVAGTIMMGAGSYLGLHS
jgi:threonine/homoserine/homoserine lactone efflux protein